jgi:hypothetical protein
MKYFNLSHYIFARIYALVKETAVSSVICAGYYSQCF